MAFFTLAVETTSNSNTGWAMQWLMPSARECQLIGVTIHQLASAAGENSGTWVVDRISAVATGSTLVPLQMDPGSRASDITDTTITVSTTLACAPTVVPTTGAKIFTLQDGWNDLRQYELMSGVAQGFGIQRSTAPTGARVVRIMSLWKE